MMIECHYRKLCGISNRGPCFFLKKVCIQGTYNNKQTNEMQKIWNIFFQFKSLPQICFAPLTICLLLLPRVCISYLLILFDFKSDMMRLCNYQQIISDVYIFSKEDPCLWQVRYFNSTYRPHSISVYFSVFRLLRLALQFSFCVEIRYQPTTKVN